MFNFCKNDIIYLNSHIYPKKIGKKMGGNGFIDSELLFSDTVHQFLQVLTMTLNSNPGGMGTEILF